MLKATTVLFFAFSAGSAAASIIELSCLQRPTNNPYTEYHIINTSEKSVTTSHSADGIGATYPLQIKPTSYSWEFSSGSVEMAYAINRNTLDITISNKHPGGFLVTHGSCKKRGDGKPKI